MNPRVEVEREKIKDCKNCVVEVNITNKNEDTIYNDAAIFSFSYWTPSRCAKILIDNSATVPPANLFTFMTVSATCLRIQIVKDFTLFLNQDLHFKKNKLKITQIHTHWNVFQNSSETIYLHKFVSIVCNNLLYI